MEDSARDFSELLTLRPPDTHDGVTLQAARTKKQCTQTERLRPRRHAQFVVIGGDKRVSERIGRTRRDLWCRFFFRLASHTRKRWTVTTTRDLFRVSDLEEILHNPLAQVGEMSSVEWCWDGLV